MSFYTAMKASLRTHGAVFGAGCSWTAPDNVPRAALTVGLLNSQQRATYGGRLGDVHLSVSMTVELWTAAAAAIGDIIAVTSPDIAEQRVRIADVETPGNGSIVLVCGPTGINTPHR